MSSAFINRLPLSNFLKTSLSLPALARNSLRFWSQRSECGSSPKPKCGERFKAGPCDKIQKEKPKEPQPAPKPLSRDKPEIKLKRSVLCCGDPCPDVLPRFDKLYYRRSDKMKRVYAQTWDECPELLIKPKVICCVKPIKAKLKKRPRKERPKTACKQEVCLQSKSKCPNLRMPRCRVARKPPSCATERKPAKCAKRKAPYPSFSECKHPKRSTRHPIECNCLKVPSICEVWSYYHKQRNIKKPTSC